MKILSSELADLRFTFVQNGIRPLCTRFSCKLFAIKLDSLSSTIFQACIYVSKGHAYSLYLLVSVSERSDSEESGRSVNTIWARYRKGRVPIISLKGLRVMTIERFKFCILQCSPYNRI